MNNYHWSGINIQGKKINGQSTAQCAAALKMQLRNQGIIPIHVKKINNLIQFFEHKIKPQLIIIFLQQFLTLLSAGIPLAKSLEIIIQGQKNIMLKELIFQIKNDVANGISLSQALANHRRYFNELTCALIAAGEESGTLETMLQRLISYQENILKIKNNMIKLLLYPLTVIIVTIIVTLLLLTIAVPQFENLFNNLNAPLPLPTRYLLDTSKFIQKYEFSILAFIFIIGIILRLLWRYSDRFAEFIRYLILNVPVIGEILRKIIIARITHTLATILAAGIPLKQALSIVSHISGNLQYTKALINAEKEIAAGRTLHITLNDSQLFPIATIQMIAIGEDSGTLDKMLFKITNWYNEQIDHSVSQLSTLLEPLIMIVLAVLIGSIVTAMYLPIFKLGNII